MMGFYKTKVLGLWIPFIFVIFIILGFFGADLFEPKFIPDSVFQVLELEGLTLKWQKTHIYSIPNNSSISALDKKVFITGNLGRKSDIKIIILDSANGEKIAQSNPVSFDADFVTDGKAIYMVDNMGSIIKYDFMQDKVLWRRPLGFAASVCCFQLLNEELQFEKHGDHFFRISTETGGVINDYYGKGYFRVEEEIAYTPLMGLTAEELNGKEIWKVDLPFGLGHFPEFQQDLIIFRGGGGISPAYAVEKHNGRILWKTRINLISNIVASKNRAYFVSADGFLYGVNTKTLKVLTRAKLEAQNNNQTEQNRDTQFLVAYDAPNHMIYLFSQNSGQLFAFQEKE